MASKARRLLAGSLVMLPWLLGPTAGFAQDQLNADTQGDAESRLIADVASQADAVEAEDRRIVQSQGPAGGFGFAPSAPQFQLSATRGDGEATISLVTELGRSRSDYNPVSGDDRRSSWTSRLYLRGVAPLDKDDEDAPRFVNLAEPLDGARITFGFVHYFSRYTLRRNDILRGLAIRTEVVGACVRQTVGAWQGGQRTPAEIALGNRYLEAYEAGLRAERRPELALLRTNNSFSDVPAEVKNACLTGESEDSPGDMLALIGRYGTPSFSEELLRSVTGNAPTFFIGAEATASQKDFSFVNRSTFVIDDDSHKGYALTGFAGIIGGRGNWSLRAGVTYARTYEGQGPITLCRPIPGTTDTQCLTGPDGAPTRNSNTVLSVEGRALVQTPLGNIGLAPVFAIDADDGEYTVNVPIYLARNDDRLLTGGIQVGYGSKEDDVSFGFFVGVPFNILN